VFSLSLSSLLFSVIHFYTLRRPVQQEVFAVDQGEIAHLDSIEGKIAVLCDKDFAKYTRLLNEDHEAALAMVGQVPEDFVFMCRCASLL
jgi:hypothetical protein